MLHFRSKFSYRHRCRASGPAPRKLATSQVTRTGAKILCLDLYDISLPRYSVLVTIAASRVFWRVGIKLIHFIPIRWLLYRWRERSLGCTTLLQRCSLTSFCSWLRLKRSQAWSIAAPLEQHLRRIAFEPPPASMLQHGFGHSGTVKTLFMN